RSSAGPEMAEDGISEDQESSANTGCGNLFWRCGAYPLGSSCRAQLGQERRNTHCGNHRRSAWHELDLGDYIEGPYAVYGQGKGGVNSDVFIEFLKRLLVGAKRAVFLIVDRGPAHISKKTKAFVATLGSRLKLVYLPAYSPDRNPDELVWKHLKADTVGRMVTTSKADFKSKVVSSMRSL